MFNFISKSRTSSHCRHRTLWRSFWLLLLLLHIPATVKVFTMAFGGGPSGSALSSLLLITLANLFFICEVIFAWSLHLLKDRRSAIAFLAVICLLHVGVIDRGFPDFAVEHNVQIWLVFTAGGLAASRFLLPVLPRRLRNLNTRIAEQRRHLARRLYYMAIPPIPTLPSPACVWLSAPLRAPPAHPL